MLSTEKESTKTREENRDVELYEIPKHFPTFGSMTVHWYQVVRDQEATGFTVWRKHLTEAEKKRFQRFARVIKAYKQVLNSGVTMMKSEKQFDTFYSENNHSLTALSDVFSRNILK